MVLCAALSLESVPQARRALQRDASGLRASVSALSVLVNGVRRWSIARDNGQGVIAALRHAYQKGRAALGSAKRSRSDLDLHEWRKQIKYFGYQLQLFQPLRPLYIGKLIRLSQRLSDYLGEDHDLALRRRKIYPNSAELPTSTAHGPSSNYSITNAPPCSENPSLWAGVCIPSHRRGSRGSCKGSIRLTVGRASPPLPASGQR